MQASTALVLDPIVDGFRLTKVLMDGGSTLNLIYEETLGKYRLSNTALSKLTQPLEELYLAEKSGVREALSLT